MKKLYYFIIPALLLGSCQSDPTLETESSPLVRTKVTELQYAQTDKIDVEALNIISPYKFVKKGNLYAFLTPSSAYRFAIYDSENGTVTRLVPAGRNEGEGMYFKKLLSDEEWADLSHFEGNANAFRLLTHSFNGRRPGGYTMTYTTLASIVKYPFESKASAKGYKYGFFQSEKEIFQQVAEELGIRRISENPLQYVRHPLVFLVEAADDICYQIMDIEDSHKMRILSYDETTNILENFYDKNEDKEDLKIIARTFKVVTDKNERIAFLRAGIINKLINACADIFCQNYETIMMGEFKSSLIKNLTGTNKMAYDKCTELAYSRIYHTNIVTQIQIAGFKILGTILKEYTDAVLKPETYYARNILSVMPEQYQVSKDDSMYTKIQTVVDYVSGMTDSYALNLYRKIKGIELPELK